MSDFFHNLDVPFTIQKPNLSAISNMRIPVDENYQVHLLDVASSLMKSILGENLLFIKKIYSNF